MTLYITNTKNNYNTHNTQSYSHSPLIYRPPNSLTYPLPHSAKPATPTPAPPRRASRNRKISKHLTGGRKLSQTGSRNVTYPNGVRDQLRVVLMIELERVGDDFRGGTCPLFYGCRGQRPAEIRAFISERDYSTSEGSGSPGTLSMVQSSVLSASISSSESVFFFVSVSTAFALGPTG